MDGTTDRRRRWAVPAAGILLGVAAVLLAVLADDDPPPEGVVTDRAEVLGKWRVVEVDGGPPPRDAVRWMRVLRGEDEHDLVFLHHDGVNSTNEIVELGSDGDLDHLGSISTLVGCEGPDGSYESCSRPSGFGTADVVRLRLTAAGSLVLLGEGGSALAVYERSG